MEISISEQCLCFFVSTLLGFILGAFYEIFRILRLAFAHKNFIIGIEDFFFCMACTFCIILLCYSYANGYYRWFVFAGIFLGFYFYFLTLGRLIQQITKPLIFAIKRTLQKIYHLMFAPLIRTLKQQWSNFSLKNHARLQEKSKNRILTFLKIRKQRKDKYGTKKEKKPKK